MSFGAGMNGLFSLPYSGSRIIRTARNHLLPTTSKPIDGMSTAPIPLLSLLRRFISEISLRKAPTAAGAPAQSRVFTSLLRAAAIPSLGYLFGWNSHLKAAYASFDATRSRNDDPTSALGERTGHSGNGSEGNLKREKVSEQNSAVDNNKEKGEPTKVPKRPPYDPNAPIYQLVNNPALYDPLRKPRNPIVLAHGLYGFDVRGFTGWPRVQIHYWSDVLQILRKKVGAEVIVTKVPSTGSIQERAATMHDGLKNDAKGREINFIAHSMGGLDCRHLISNIKPTEYKPLALMTVCTPHRGSPFMDWLLENIGIGAARQALPGVTPPTPAVPLPSSIISFIDSPAYSNLTSNYLNIHFNPSTPDSPDVKYWSIGARTSGMSFFHPLWLPKLILDGHEEKLQKQGIESFGNDGLVTADSAKWGEFLGVLEGCDHWDIRGAGGISAHYAEGVKEKESKEMSGGGGSEDNKWNWSDWQRFLGAWDQDKTKRKARSDAAKAGATTEEKQVERANVVKALEDPGAKQRMMDEVKIGRPNGNGTSTMDTLLDWVVENVPGVGAVKVPIKLVVGRTTSITGSNKKVEDGPRVKPPRFDLERFYVALSRKLYDEGL